MSNVSAGSINGIEIPSESRIIPPGQIYQGLSKMIQKPDGECTETDISLIASHALLLQQRIAEIARGKIGRISDSIQSKKVEKIMESH